MPLFTSAVQVSYSNINIRRVVDRSGGMFQYHNSINIRRVVDRSGGI